MAGPVKPLFQRVTFSGANVKWATGYVRQNNSFPRAMLNW